jgi:hypothetical protein
VARSPAGAQRDCVEVADRGAMAGPAGTLRPLEDRARAAAAVDRGRRLGQHPSRGDRRGHGLRSGVGDQCRLLGSTGSPARRWNRKKGLHGHGRCARGRGRRARTLPRRTEHEDPPRRGPARAAPTRPAYPGTGRGQPAGAAAARRDPRRPGRARSSTVPAGDGDRGQGVLASVNQAGVARPQDSLRQPGTRRPDRPPRSARQPWRTPTRLRR